MRIVLNDVDPSVSERGPVDDETLARLYAYPVVDRWLRANMVGTLDGAATGADGKTGSINNEADHAVFTLLRTLADVIVVGAGTARSEGYGRPRPVRGERAVLREGRSPAPALAVVSRTANLPARLTLPDGHEGAGEVLLVTCGLAARGMSRMLTEGGPRLLRDLAAAGVVDEVCLTVVPRLIAGEHPRILTGDGVDVSLAPRLLLEADGTLLGRWQRPAQDG